MQGGHLDVNVNFQLETVGELLQSALNAPSEGAVFMLLCIEGDPYHSVAILVSQLLRYPFNGRACTCAPVHVG